MLMRHNKAETAVHGCHCPGDMAVRMRKARAGGLVFECVSCFYSFMQKGKGLDLGAPCIELCRVPSLGMPCQEPWAPGHACV